MALEMKYFVLKPKATKENDVHAFASRVAMRAYARVIQGTDVALAADISSWVERESKLALDIDLEAARWKEGSVE